MKKKIILHIAETADALVNLSLALGTKSTNLIFTSLIQMLENGLIPDKSILFSPRLVLI